jgi:hypothetical protein
LILVAAIGHAEIAVMPECKLRKVIPATEQEQRFILRNWLTIAGLYDLLFFNVMFGVYFSHYSRRFLMARK